MHLLETFEKVLTLREGTVAFLQLTKTLDTKSDAFNEKEPGWCFMVTQTFQSFFNRLDAL
jgi:hypothetical protein